MHAHDRRGELQNKCLNVSAAAGHVRAQSKRHASKIAPSVYGNTSTNANPAKGGTYADIRYFGSAHETEASKALTCVL